MPVHKELLSVTLKTQFYYEPVAGQIDVSAGMPEETFWRRVD